jgi:hypothetical protein
LHPPEAHTAPRSFRDFLRAYAMIVLSILTALGFERLAVAWQNHAAAEASRVRIERELDADAADLKHAIDFNKAGADKVRATLGKLLAAMKANKADPAATESIVDGSTTLQIGVSTMTWQRDAWDAAIADQSASHLDPADLRRYAAIYAQARDAEESFKLALDNQVVAQLPEVALERSLNRMDAHDCALLMVRYLAAIRAINDVQNDLLDIVRNRGNERNAKATGATPPQPPHQ